MLTGHSPPSPGWGGRAGAVVVPCLFHPAAPTHGLCFKVKVCPGDPGAPFCSSHLLLVFPPAPHWACRADAGDTEPKAGLSAAPELVAGGVLRRKGCVESSLVWLPAQGVARGSVSSVRFHQLIWNGLFQNLFPRSEAQVVLEPTGWTGPHRREGGRRQRGAVLLATGPTWTHPPATRPAPARTAGPAPAGVRGLRHRLRWLCYFYVRAG